jgi:hypothetical protein
MEPLMQLRKRYQLLHARGAVAREQAETAPGASPAGSPGRGPGPSNRRLRDDRSTLCGQGGCQRRQEPVSVGLLGPQIPPIAHTPTFAIEDLLTHKAPMTAMEPVPLIPPFASSPRIAPQEPLEEITPIAVFEHGFDWRANATIRWLRPTESRRSPTGGQRPWSLASGSGYGTICEDLIWQRFHADLRCGRTVLHRQRRK